jgi:RNase adaptor protein for sRNA GlmZ degradation
MEDIPANLNHQISEKSDKILKTINLISFSFDSGKPKITDHDIIISVRDMFNVEKKIRDTHNGTSKELQRALLNIEANKSHYDEIVEHLTTELLDMFNTSCSEEIDIYIGCNAGTHRSVAVVCMLFNELPDIFRTLDIINRTEKEIILNIDHRDLEIDGVRKNKKSLEQERLKRRDRRFKE